MLPALPTLLSEGLSETRAAAKQIIFGLTREASSNPAELERLERLLRKTLSEPAYRKVRESIDLANASANGGTPWWLTHTPGDAFAVVRPRQRARTSARNIADVLISASTRARGCGRNRRGCSLCGRAPAATTWTSRGHLDPK